MQTDKNKHHIPVMANEVLEYLVPETGDHRFVDCTLGFGGHSELVLKKNRKVQVLGIDQDSTAINYSKDRLSFAGNRFRTSQGRFSQILEHLKSVSWGKVDYILLDIGVSSYQINIPERGFSYRFRGPLDMRMGQDNRKTASQILNHAPVEELIRIFREYGEIRSAKKLATALVERRAEKPWFDTAELAEFCNELIPPQRNGSMPVPTLCFQALRIAVNGELEELEEALNASIGILNKGGRVGVISYHSLEDRIVKRIFKRESSNCLCPPGLPICKCGHKASVKEITKKPLIPTEEETIENNRARSAKFRVIEKL